MNRNNDTTCDDLGIGGFSLLQPKKGYRFSVDAPILAALVPLSPGETVLDLGCGSGVLPLLLLGREPSLALCGIELREAPFALAKENMARNGVTAELICGDAMKAASLLKGRTFDLILTNPPYYPLSACRLPRHEDIAAAKTERFWDQKIMMEQAFALLKKEGRFALIFDGTRQKEIIALAENTGFFLHRVLEIFGRDGESGKSRVYLEFGKTKSESVGCKTLSIYDSEGQMTPQMKRILNIYDRTRTLPRGDAHRQPR